MKIEMIEPTSDLAAALVRLAEQLTDDDAPFLYRSGLVKHAER